MRRVAWCVWFLAAGWVGGCASEPEAPAAGQVHEVLGIVRSVAADGSSAMVSHEEIPGLMPAMTMQFALESPAVAAGVGPGAKVSMTLRTDPTWRVVAMRLAPEAQLKGVAQVQREDDERAMVEPAPSEPREGEVYYQVGIGQRVPEFRLITQDNEPLALSQLRGKAVVLSFIYTRCPVPELCPMVVRRLAELQQRLGPELEGRTYLLAVTIDPQHDTAEVLSSYAKKVGLPLRQTALLTGPIRKVALLSSFFGLEFYDESDGSITHKQRLVVIDAEGRLHAELKGPGWTVEQVVGLVRQVLAEASEPAAG